MLAPPEEREVLGVEREKKGGEGTKKDERERRSGLLEAGASSET